MKPLKNPEGKHLTFRDYWNQPDGERWELIDGLVYDMTPSPARIHQKISVELCRQLANFFQGKTCEVYAAPFGVRLPKENEADDDICTVVEPDIAVICDPNKLDDKGCRGAPDMIIEITSPGTSSKDHLTKKALYERHGVKEYWLVHPLDRLLIIYHLEKPGKFGPSQISSAEALIHVKTFPGLTIDFNTVFPPPETRVSEPPPRKSRSRKG